MMSSTTLKQKCSQVLQSYVKRIKQELSMYCELYRLYTSKSEGLRISEYVMCTIYGAKIHEYDCIICTSIYTF